VCLNSVHFLLARLRRREHLTHLLHNRKNLNDSVDRRALSQVAVCIKIVALCRKCDFVDRVFIVL